MKLANLTFEQDVPHNKNPELAREYMTEFSSQENQLLCWVDQASLSKDAKTPNGIGSGKITKHLFKLPYQNVPAPSDSPTSNAISAPAPQRASNFKKGQR